MSFSTCIIEVTVFIFQTGVKRKAAPPALQYQPNSAGGKKAKVDASGQQVKNAVATLNELKQGLVYELVETKGKLFCRERKQFIPPRDSSRTLLRVPSGRQQSNFQRGRKVGSYQSLWCCLSPVLSLRSHLCVSQERSFALYSYPVSKHWRASRSKKLLEVLHGFVALKEDKAESFLGKVKHS